MLLTPAGKAVLFGSGPVRLLLPSEPRLGPGAPAGRGPPGLGARRRTERRDPASPGDAALFERLRARRARAGPARGGVPPYVVASDRTLRELAEVRPGSRAELERIYGIGPAKAAKYGEDLLEVVRRGS